MAGRKKQAEEKPETGQAVKSGMATKARTAAPAKSEPETGQKTGPAWEAIHAEYITGKATYKELAEKYQISVSTLSKKATKEGWKNDRAKVGEKLAKKMTTRAARAREKEALKGINLTKYIADIWTDNLKQLMLLIQQTPTTMIDNPQFAASLPRGVRETYDLIQEMSGRGYMNRKLANEEKKLKIERERFELEKQKWEEEKRRRDEQMSRTGEEDEAWKVVQDDEEVEGINA